MGACGHTDPGLTLRIYAQQIHRRDGERDRLKALVNGGDQGGNQAPVAPGPIAAAAQTAQAARV